MLGPLLPIIAARWSLTDAQSGLFFASQFAGATTANALSVVLAPRFGVLKVMAAGFALMATGVAALGSPSWQGGLAAVMCYGMGFGFAIPASNVAVSELNAGRRAAALNILNLCWGAGAVLAAPTVAFCRNHGGLVVPQVIIVILAALISGWLLRHGQITHARTDVDAPAVASHAIGLRHALPWILSLFGFLYVGTECAVGGWATSYAQRLSGPGSNAWVIAQSAFWAALLVGRGTAPALLRRMSPERLILWCLVLTATGVAALLVSAGTPGLTLAVALCGLGLAAIFPTATGIYTQIMGARSAGSAGVFFVLSSFGGATLPGLVGLVSMHTGTLRLGMSVPAATTAAMIGLHLVVISKMRASPAACGQSGV
jgi:MFS transporter, FHS family, glucose/mannose:H+ symporter